MARFPVYEWDKRLARYRNPASGQVVSQARVRAALDRAIRMEGLKGRALIGSLRSKEVTTREFELGMREVIKNTQLFSAAAAKGGWAQLTPSDYGIVGQRVREQYGYLAQFVDEMKAGLPADGIAARRAESYADAGRTAYHAVERNAQRDAGATEERSVLSPADHCDECIVEDAKGFQPIGQMKPIGQRECLNGCQCRVEYR